jgi:hypothetical protein
LDEEILTRVSAQRGLVRYMRDHGEGHRIGYDPDHDPAVSAWQERVRQSRSMFTYRQT